MNKHLVTISWTRSGAVFTDNRYSRRHEWKFDGGLIIPASASPFVVPIPLSDPAGIDPEEAFVASLSSCHMLWFLSIAAKVGFKIDQYQDKAEGIIEKDLEGQLAITIVTLRPVVIFSGDRIPEHNQVLDMHHLAHESCFIARSVKTEIRCEPIPALRNGLKSK